MTTRVRRVNSLDIADLIRIADETNLNPWSAQNYIDELQTDTSILLAIGTENRRTIGFLAGRIVPGGDHEGFDGEVYNLAVIVGFQGLGHAQDLFDHFLGACREQSVMNVWLEVRESNSRAIRFYARNGFEPVQKRNAFYENPREHAILMRLSLK